MVSPEQIFVFANNVSSKKMHSLDAENPGWDVIMWMDHRAKEQTAAINRVDHSVKDFVGGSVSVEMETPKLLWVKERAPNVWSAADRFFDLSDYLVWRASGSEARSLCSTVCKWTYEVGTDGGIKGWNEGFFRAIGLEDLADEGFIRIGQRVVRCRDESCAKTLVGDQLAILYSPGEFCSYLCPSVSSALGLNGSVAVAAGIIDAHAGALGMLACSSARCLK